MAGAQSELQLGLAGSRLAAIWPRSWSEVSYSILIPGKISPKARSLSNGAHGGSHAEVPTQVC